MPIVEVLRSESPFELTPLQRALSAAFGGSLTVLATLPLDVVKTRLQAAAPAHAGAAFVAPRAAFATAREIVRAEGARALWRGIAPSLVMAVPSQMVYFTIYDPARAAMERWGGRGSAASALAPAFAGMFARAVTVSVASPLELVRTRAMARTDAARGESLLAALRAEVARAGGARNLWRGWAPTLVRDVPFSGVYWFLYERVYHALTPAREAAGGASHAAQWSRSFASGFFAGSVAAIATTPIDVVKTRRQLARGAASGGLRAELLEIARTEGVRGLFVGGALRVARVGPACAIMISSYELGKRLLGGS
jgi:solute carrier family 25 protein 39/40